VRGTRFPQAWKALTEASPRSHAENGWIGGHQGTFLPTGGGGGDGAFS
jgi:hypothetical protein